MSIEERFWSKVQKGDGCWEWTGEHRQRYGVLRVDGHRRVPAHRISYELAYGPIPDGMLVCHRCDNPPCVRPDHLFLGTNLDNVRDMGRKGRKRIWTGSSNPSAKIDEETVRLIRARLSAGGVSQRQVARDLGIGRSIVHAIMRGKNWSHVP